MTDTQKMMSEARRVSEDQPPAYIDTLHRGDSSANMPNSKTAYPTQPGVASTPAPELKFLARQEEMKYSKTNLRYTRWVLVFPLWLNIFFCGINAIIPGLGMLVACFFTCLGHTVVRGDSRLKIMLVNFALGLVSLITLFIGIGYMLAFAWCAASVGVNRVYYNQPIEEHEIRDVPGVEHPADATDDARAVV
eukprot:scpid69817/ scgid14966/ 